MALDAVSGQVRSSHARGAGVAPIASTMFGTLFLGFLFTFTIVAPHPTPSQLVVVRFIMALSAALFSSFFVGGIILKGSIAGMRLSAAGGFALFVLMEWGPNPFLFLQPAPEAVIDHSSADSKRETITLDKYPGENVLQNVVAVPCSKETTLVSSISSRSVKTSVVTQNDTNRLLQLFWIDYSGKRQLYSVIRPRDSVSMDTWNTHPWVVTNSSEECLAAYLPGTQAGLVALR
jgi:von Hippel-Lindau disease tumor supressor